MAFRRRTLLQLVGGIVAGFAGHAAARRDDGPRVRKARREHAGAIAALFERARVAYPPKEVLLRAFKDEDVLELWARGPRQRALTLVQTYRICARSGRLGPKRAAGDSQVPEGFYRISGFNPQSSYHLSLRVDYPNASDRKRATSPDPGGDIFIHGNCVTIGCLPIQDGPIEELYVIAADAHAARAPLHVHIFPARLDGAPWDELRASTRDPGLLAFWEELRPGYLAFERDRKVPKIAVARDGPYRVEPPAPVARRED